MQSVDAPSSERFVTDGHLRLSGRNDARCTGCHQIRRTRATRCHRQTSGSCLSPSAVSIGDGQRNMWPTIAAAFWSSRSRIGRWTIDPGHLLSRRRGRGRRLAWGQGWRVLPTATAGFRAAHDNPQASVAITRRSVARGFSAGCAANWPCGGRNLVARPLMSTRWGCDYCGPSVISPVSRFTTPSRGRSRGVLVPRRIVVCASRL